VGKRIEFWKRVRPEADALIRGTLLTGCTVQIILGAAWLGCNFFRVQDFGEPESALYRRIYGMLGRQPCIVYLFQLACAFAAGYCFLRKLQGKVYSAAEDGGEVLSGRASGGEVLSGRASGGEVLSGGASGGEVLSGGASGGEFTGGTFCGRGYCGSSFRWKLSAVWGSLVLLSFPFAMQCHLAVLPDSFAGSLFLLMLYFLADFVLPGSPSGFEGGRKRKRLVRLRGLACAAVCAALMIGLSGAADRERREAVPGPSIQSALASRLAWPSLFNDASYWPEELQEITKDVLWEATFYPGNMKILQEAVERSVGAEAAKEYYIQMAETGWKYRRPVVIRQIGWDMLGYAVTPLIVPGQLRGEGYDSCTGRNYEIMRGNAPVLTKYYVEYGCWWFGICLALALCLALLRAGRMAARGRGILWGRLAALAGTFALLAGIQVFLLAMGGAGWMDYKRTIAVNELWYSLTVLLAGGKPGERSGKPW